MPESEAVMTGKGCEQISSEDYLGEDRSQALRYRDCRSDKIIGDRPQVGYMDVVVTGIQTLLVLDSYQPGSSSWELGGGACCSS